MRAGWALSSLWLATVACGGRYQRDFDEIDAPSAGTAGGGASSRGGSSNGGEAAAGSGGAGAACTCDPFACPLGTRAVVEPGGCCPSCEPDPVACDAAAKAYVDYRREIVEEYTDYGCAYDYDCLSTIDQTTCDQSCDFHILSGEAQVVTKALQRYAELNCGAACSHPHPPCPVPEPAHCVAGLCQ